MLEKIRDKMFKKKPPGKLTENDEWKKLLKTVDKIFEATKAERDKMTTYLDRYNGKIWDETKLQDSDSRAFINYFFSTVQQIAPMLTDNRPRWNLVANNPAMQKLAASYSKALAYFWETRDMNFKLLLAIMDAMIMRLGIMKLGFDPSDGFGGNLTVDIVDPRTFFIAPGYTDPWEAPFCGTKVKKPLSYVKKRFPNIEGVQPESSISSEDDGTKFVKFGDVHDFELEVKFCWIYEVWMRDDAAMIDLEEETEETDENGEKKKKKTKVQKYPYGKFVYFTPNEFLAEEPCDAKINRAPFVFFYDYVKPHDTFGTGELDNTEGLILEMNKVFQAMVNHFRKYHNPNVVADTATGIDPDKLKETYHQGGQIYAYDSVINGNKEPIKPVLEPQLNAISAQLFNLGPHLIEEVSGVTEWAKGVLTTKQEKSASEASILIESSYTRVRQRVRNLEWSIKRLCWLLVTMMQQYYTEPRSYWNREDDDIVYGEISNSRAMATEQTVSPDTVKKVEEKKQLSPEEQQEWDDYRQIAELFGEFDPVHFDFEVVIDTNSTLPMDKQSLANLGMKLFNARAIDAQALLEVLQWPRKDEIIGRMKELAEERKNASIKRPTPGPVQPQVASPGNPGDVQEFMNLLQSQGGQNG